MPKVSQIEYWDLSRIQPYDNNAKLHPQEHVDQIAASIGEFDFLDPVAVDESGVLLEGHGRVLAAKARGMGSIPVIQITGLSDAQKIAYRLTHNKLTINTGFDSELLKADFDILNDLDFDLNLAGFDAEEIELLEENENTKLFGSSSKGGSDEWDKPEARCELGQIWQLGRHRLLVGDSTDQLNVKRLLEEQQPSLIWSDPPYGMKCQHKDGAIGGGGALNTLPRNILK
ncbi:ParB/Srx family N-terminal domain-containing protein [Aetokthonos hydrillicola Thurmond2011]|uniref:ParB/Srx family N-terminal domain-containing protein n=1 Tax=Aetokthonos hydrillicola Thurmond2011 TaxID=2712845 RepID=A0AAP5M5M1_9CYAN|nr:ParB/Srx family N-terminal domain-containing protein [Aetokthonos hydrillicola]MBO3462964.1 ParB N-terminal domain-containing protein [Aetokthonos hydrillicola CCALA 1050]MBW4591260.1 ParB/Srx family N-terminal domain-containing protein [Aetokthonos hydrillicola CCALA 1050]MDR9893300.1 ParB/Srx family N-terminal domain-containing protein [Aetokthonos hydrillicola Thurmond2011]